MWNVRTREIGLRPRGIGIHGDGVELFEVSHNVGGVFLQSVDHGRAGGERLPGDGRASRNLGDDRQRHG